MLVGRPKTAGTEGTRYRSSRANSQSLVDHLTGASAAPTTTDPKDPAARQGPLSTTHVLASVQRVTEPALVVRNATLRGRPGTWTIVLDQDAIRAVERQQATTPVPAHEGPTELDAEGNLVTIPFVDAHLHLCKVHTLDAAGDNPLAEYTSGTMGGALTAIEGAAAVKRGQTADDVYARARQTLLASVANGVRVVQAFADVDPVAGLTGVEGLLRAREEFRGRVDVQVVAFPQDGLLKAPGTEELVIEAIRRGADVVGGIPWIEHTDADAKAHVDAMVTLAQRTNRRVAMLVDDAGDPSLRTTEMLAAALLERGMVGRGSAQHARAMATCPEPTVRRLAGLAKAAGLGFVTDPHTGPLHLRVTDLLAAGVPVALGQDDIEDAYYPFGRHNLLEVAFVAAHVLGYLADPRLETLLDMVTTQGYRVLGMPPRAIEPGAPADLLVLDGRTAREVLTRHSAPLAVVTGGRVVASTRTVTELF